ncbi:hypothetical protein D3C73_1544950 [compost metagenome]
MLACKRRIEISQTRFRPVDEQPFAHRVISDNGLTLPGGLQLDMNLVSGADIDVRFNLQQIIVSLVNKRGLRCNRYITPGV